MVKALDVDTLEGYYKPHPPFMRAHMIDWLLHIIKVMRQEDESLIFTATSICDQYLSANLEASRESSLQDYQLTCLACVLIASKKLDIEPFDVERC